MANWHAFEIQVPGKDVLEPVRNTMETLVVFLDVLKAILDTVKVFLVDFGNPIRALVEALISIIEELLLSLKATGLYGYFDAPDPTTDPNFDRFAGGFPAFEDRFKASLFDAQDFNRPQPRQGSTKSGFVILVVDAASPFTLIERFKQLMRFFGKEFSSPRYEPPDNLQVFPVGSDGDPITSVAAVFQKGPINAIELQWSLPSSLETPDPGFTDVVSKVSKEFVPPTFLIERSTINPASQKIDVLDLQNAEAAGLVEVNRAAYVSGTGDAVLVRETLRDEYGDPIVKFQKYLVIDPTDATSILGQLGKYRYIDTDVEADTTYYYRVRAYSGKLDLTGDQINFPSYDELTFSIESNMTVMAWPSAVPHSSVVMGKASGVTSAIVPTPMDPETFDVLENIKRLLQTAFSLDFHLPVDPALVDTNGNPTTVIQIGRGSLTNLASALAIFEALLTVGTLSGTNTINDSFQPDPITGDYPELPWENSSVRKQAARLADATASAMLQAGSDAITGFRSLMEGALPYGPTNVSGTTLEEVCFNFTPTPYSDVKAATAFVNGYSNQNLRQNVLAGIQYLKKYSLGGTPVDWISVVPLRDIVPWSGQLVYDLLDKVQALLDAFNGVMQEIKAFADLLERKIEALERFLEFLINILNFIESLQLGAYVLSVPELSGSVQSWVDAIETAGGVKPPTGPGGYSAGVAFGYVATDVLAFKTAFSLIFG